MDFFINVAFMLLIGIIAGVTSIVKKQGWKKTLLFTGVGFGIGYLTGYFSGPFIISFY